MAFPIPLSGLDQKTNGDISGIYRTYLDGIEKNANTRHSTAGSKYKVESFKEYKIGRSKRIIDDIDDIVGPLYGLTKGEIEFIKNYEIGFRMSESENDTIVGDTDDELSISNNSDIIIKQKNIKSTQIRKSSLSPSLTGWD
jgi:hypothetical protein